MIDEINVRTEKEGFIDITSRVAEAVRNSGIDEGTCLVFCPHTTAAITINENADPDVIHDMLIGLDRAFPDRSEYRHSEGNSAAHLKSSCVGASETVIVTGGQLLLGTWQGIYLCEFDGPRTRRVFVQVSD
jgi:secondary thiamine-phosphate synthase enzyme